MRYRIIFNITMPHSSPQFKAGRTCNSAEEIGGGHFQLPAICSQLIAFFFHPAFPPTLEIA